MEKLPLMYNKLCWKYVKEPDAVALPKYYTKRKMCNDGRHVVLVLVIHIWSKLFYVNPCHEEFQYSEAKTREAYLVSTECAHHEYPGNNQAGQEDKHASSCVCCVLYMCYMLGHCWLRPRGSPPQQCDWAECIQCWAEGVLIGGLPCCSAVGRWRLTLLHVSEVALPYDWL